MHDFLTEPYSRELMEDFKLGTGVRRYSNKEIQEAVVQDVLQCYIYNLDDHANIKLTQLELLRFVPLSLRRKVVKAMNEVIGMGLIHFNQDFCLVPVVDKLQAAMDFCGVWFGNFQPPKDVEVIYGNPGNIEKAVQQTGSIKNLAKSLTMDLNANVSGVGHA